jgi:drug/metabolite transporter (DMT)-like permease
MTCPCTRRETAKFVTQKPKKKRVASGEKREASGEWRVASFFPTFAPMSKTLKAQLAMLATTLIFGMHYTIAKGLMPGFLQPMQLLFLRLLGGVLLFWIFQRFYVREKVVRKDLLILAVCGLFGFTLNQALFYEGLNLTTPVDASIIHVLNPVFVLIFASILIREKVTWLKIAGITLGAAGALTLILYGKSVNMSTNSFAGNILVMLNMLFYALYLVLLKPLTVRYHAMTLLKWTSLFGFLFILPFSFHGVMNIQLHLLDLKAWSALAYIILLNTFLAYLLINFALKIVTASSVSFYTYLQPVIASVMSVSLGTEMITWPKVIAALLIFSGVFLVNRNREEILVR